METEIKLINGKTLCDNTARASASKNAADIERLKENQGSGGNVDQSGGLTTAQIEAIHGMFKVCAYDPSANVEGAYTAFKTAFGITESDDGDDSGGNGDSDTGDGGETIPATGITLSASALTFDSYIAQILVATVEPSNSTDKVVWTSSNDDIAKVSSAGIVTPIAPGNVTIMATAGSVSASCNVTVELSESYEYGYYLDNGSISQSKSAMMSTRYVEASGNIIVFQTAMLDKLYRARIAEFDSSKAFVKRQYVNVADSFGAITFELSESTAYVRVGFEKSNNTAFSDAEAQALLSGYRVYASESDAIDDAVELVYEQGGLSSADGSEEIATGRCRSDYIAIDGYIQAKAYNEENSLYPISSIAFRYYDNEKGYLSAVTDAKYARMLLLSANATTVTGAFDNAIVLVNGTLYRLKQEV